MPTEYTSDIANGISFRKFAINCARAFGAAIALRDEDSSVEPTPENVKFNSDNYHSKELKKAQSRKKAFLKKSAAQLKQSFEKDRKSKITYCKSKIKENDKLRAKYESMLEKVNNWQPPSNDHFEMKRFMQKQIAESIDFDCGNDYYWGEIKGAENKTFADYKTEKLKSFDWSIEYHEKKMQKAKTSDENRSSWIKQLIDSLPEK